MYTSVRSATKKYWFCGAFCRALVRYMSHFPTTSGGSTPPYPCIYIPKNAYDQIWTNLDNVYAYA